MIDAEEPFFFAEVGVAGKLKKLASSPAGDKLYTRLMEARKSSGNEALSVDIEAIQHKTHMEYDDIQAAAIRTEATAKVMVLTGGPGTGKTTTTHGIISAYKAYGLKILLAAPTGRAAKRMTEATGLEAKTMEGNTEYAAQKSQRLVALTLYVFCLLRNTRTAMTVSFSGSLYGQAMSRLQSGH